MLESGVELLQIKTLLGHSSLNSTMAYLHLANTTKGLPNPADLLELPNGWDTGYFQRIWCGILKDTFDFTCPVQSVPSDTWLQNCCAWRTFRYLWHLRFQENFLQFLPEPALSQMSNFRRGLAINNPILLRNGIRIGKPGLPQECKEFTSEFSG